MLVENKQLNCMTNGIISILPLSTSPIYLRFYVPLKNFHLYGDITITGEGLQKFGLCSALRAFEQGGIFIVPHLL
jgi:hypothetical protein